MFVYTFTISGENSMTTNRKAVALISLLAASTAFFTPVNLHAADTNWSDSIKVSGDFRYRLENVDQEGNEDRDRSRFRARISLDATVNDTVKVGVRLASGNDDPVSTNQSFDKFGSTKDLGIDRAFVAWTPAKGSTVIAGKMAVPFYKPNKSPLLWDGDLNPEGLAYQYKNNGFFASVARLSLDECSSCDDSYMNGVQAGYSYKMTNGSKLTFGLGQYAFDLNAAETGFADEYNETEFFADYSTNVYAKPLVVYANYVVNGDGEALAAAAGLDDDLDTGYELGFKYGKVKGAGSWDLGYTYKSLDVNAVFPLWTDSDFAGGGTDGEGHILKFGYGVNKNFSIGLTHFVNERNISTENDADPATNPLDYSRTMLDFKFKF